MGLIRRPPLTFFDSRVGILLATLIVSERTLRKEDEDTRLAVH